MDGPPARVEARRDYAFAGERLVGTEDPQNPETSRMYATVDHLGTPRLWTDSSGQVLKKLKYYPFGKEATPSDQGPIALQFTGHERDANDLTQAGEDIDYMHARNELPGMGRFLSMDPARGLPARPQSWNRYSYAIRNPLVLVDRDGRSPHDFEGGTEEEREEAKKQQAKLRRVLRPEVVAFILEDYGIDLRGSLESGKGTTVRLEPLGELGPVGKCCQGRFPWSNTIHLNTDLDLFGSEGLGFMSGLLHESVHWAAEEAGWVFSKRGRIAPALLSDVEEILRDYSSRDIMMSNHDRAPYAVELLQFGRIPTLQGDFAKEAP